MHFSSLHFLAIGTAVAADHTMGFIGCSMAENVAQGYVADGGKRMWPNYGTSGQVVQSWTDVNSASWKLYDQQVAKYGKPDAVWVQICIFAQQGATTLALRRKLAAKAYARTASYDSAIASWFAKQQGEAFPERLTITAERVQTLRYGRL